LATLLGTIREVREVQSANAPYPIEVTLLGMITETREVRGVKLERPWNA
jgi:hypothetical protein